MSAVEQFKEALARTVVELKLFLDQQYQDNGIVVFDPENVAAHGNDVQLTLLAFGELTKRGMVTVRSDLYCDNGHLLWSGTPDRTEKYLKMECPVEECDHNDGLAEENSENVAHERLLYVLKDPPKRFRELLEPLMPQIEKDVVVYGSAWLRFTKGEVTRVVPSDVVVKEK